MVSWIAGLRRRHLLSSMDQRWRSRARRAVARALDRAEGEEAGQ